MTDDTPTTPAGRHGHDGDTHMHSITLFPGDTAIVNGAELTVSRTVTLRSTTPVERRSSPGLADLPETALRINALWPHPGHRVPMTQRHDLRCPCGSAYIRRSATHHSCQHCQRVWDNQTVDAQEQR